MKISRALLATVMYFVILIAIYYVHVNHLKVNVVFYAAVGDALLAALIAGVLLGLVSIFSVFNAFEKIQLIIIWLLMGYALAISVPAVIDRSLSFYILEKLEQRGGSIRQDSFERVFVNEYMKEHRLVDVRLTEQLESGTIIIENGCVSITKKGRQFANFSRTFRKSWLPKRRLLMGKYTDDLTDPFRSSAASSGYECR